jgi:pimeloyl-ACP methyl ester carboxylesterase
MKKIRLINPVFVLAGLVACAENNQPQLSKPAGALNQAAAKPDTLERGKVIPAVYCQADPTQSYAIYIPLVATRQMPVMYFFDPHGNGSLPLNKYKALADKFGFVFIGSNNSKNGNEWGVTENILNKLFDDSRKRAPVSTQLTYVCGFSGGGKVACYSGFRHNEVKGVIAIGGAIPDMPDSNRRPFTFVAIAGEGDMNMTELVELSRQLDHTSTVHRLLTFDGKHEWAPVATMEVALSSLELDAIRAGLLPGDPGKTNRFLVAAQKRIADYEKAGRLLKAAQEYKILAGLVKDGIITGRDDILAQYHSLESSSAYSEQLKAQQHWLVTETVWKNEFMKRFEQLDTTYWDQTIPRLVAAARLSNDEGSMNKRLLAYLSLAFYSFSNQLLAGNRDEEARYFVELYKKVDPTNSEAWYFSAILHARERNSTVVQQDLETAAVNGFTDRQRLRQQPEFLNLGLDYLRIENKMTEKN